MAITATTLSAAITSGQISFGVASATGISAPTFSTGAGFTTLKVDQEFMFVTGVSGTVVSVLRAQMGTIAAAHANGAQVQLGGMADFGQPVEVVGSSLSTTESVGSFNWPSTFLSGSADVISATVPGSYIIKTAGVDSATLALPAVAAEGNVIMIYSDTTNAHIVTSTAGFANGTALKTTATFAAFRGAGMILRAVNLTWHVVAVNNVVLT